MYIASSPVKLVKSFSDSKADLSRMDGNLTQWENNGRTYPGSGVQDSFKQMARDLDDATTDFKDQRPDQVELARDLKRDTLNLGYDAGMTRGMYQSSSTFGSGWSKDMDPAIASTQKAIDVLTDTQAPGDAAPVPPKPLKVMKDLSDVQADLTRWDANFTQWQSNGHIYPNRSVSSDVLEVAGKLYDARDAVRALHPEETELIKRLQQDIIHVAGNAGQTRHMYNQSSTFGSGWSTSLDQSIADVRQAIDVVADNA